MSQLKKRIRQLERKLEADQAVLERRATTLQIGFESPVFLLLSLASGFAAGYFLGHETTPQDGEETSTKPGFSLIKEIHSNVNLLLPLLFL